MGFHHSPGTLHSRTEYSNTVEAEGKVLKTNYMKMIKDHKEEVKQSLIGIQENTNEQLDEINKFFEKNPGKHKKTMRRNE